MFARECINPSGEARADFRNAITAVTIAKSFGSKKAKISDFIPKFGIEKRKRMSKEEASNYLMQLSNSCKELNKI